MDMKNGLTAALVVGLGYFGIKGIKDRNYRKHLVKEYGAEEGCPKCGDVEDYFINDCCDTPNCFYCGDECYVRVNNEGRPINEDHVVNCTEHQCCTEFMGGSRLYGAEEIPEYEKYKGNDLIIEPQTGDFLRGKWVLYSWGQGSDEYGNLYERKDGTLSPPYYGFKEAYDTKEEAIKANPTAKVFGADSSPFMYSLREQIACDSCGMNLNERHHFYHFPEAVQKALGMKTPYICSYSDDPMCLIDGFIGNVPDIDRDMVSHWEDNKAESWEADYNKPMPTQHWMSELAYVQRFIENLHDNYYSMIPEHLHDSLDKCYDIMDDMVKDSRKAEAAEIVEYECARCGGLGDLCRGCSGLGADYPEEFGSCDLPEFPCPYCDATGKVTSNEKAKEFSRSIGYQLERVGEGMLGFSLFPTRMYHSKEKLEKIKAHKEEIMAQVANHYGLEPAEIEEDFWWADRWERGHDEFIEEVKATNGWGDPDILEKILNNPEKWGGDEKIR